MSVGGAVRSTAPRRAGTFTTARINNAGPQHGEKFQLLPLRSLSTLVRAFYAAQLMTEEAPMIFNSRISQCFVKEREGGGAGKRREKTLRDSYFVNIQSS